MTLRYIAKMCLMFFMNLICTFIIKQPAILSSTFNISCRQRLSDLFVCFKNAWRMPAEKAFFKSIHQRWYELRICKCEITFACFYVPVEPGPCIYPFWFTCQPPAAPRQISQKDLPMYIKRGSKQFGHFLPNGPFAVFHGRNVCLPDARFFR